MLGAVTLAWAKRDPHAPLKKSARFRDTLPRQADGRRQKAPATDFVNETSKVLEGRSTGEKKPEPEEIALARFADREAMMAKARGAGLTARELELYEFFLRNPAATRRQVADHFGISVNTVKTHKSASSRP